MQVLVTISRMANQSTHLLSKLSIGLLAGSMGVLKLGDLLLQTCVAVLQVGQLLPCLVLFLSCLLLYRHSLLSHTRQLSAPACGMTRHFPLSGAVLLNMLGKML